MFHSIVGSRLVNYHLPDSHLSPTYRIISTSTIRLRKVKGLSLPFRAVTTTTTLALPLGLAYTVTFSATMGSLPAGPVTIPVSRFPITIPRPFPDSSVSVPLLLGAVVLLAFSLSLAFTVTIPVSITMSVHSDTMALVKDFYRIIILFDTC